MFFWVLFWNPNHKIFRSYFFHLLVKYTRLLQAWTWGGFRSTACCSSWLTPVESVYSSLNMIYSKITLFICHIETSGENQLKDFGKTKPWTFPVITRLPLEIAWPLTYLNSSFSQSVSLHVQRAAFTHPLLLLFMLPSCHSAPDSHVTWPVKHPDYTLTVCPSVSGEPSFHAFFFCWNPI